MNDTDTHLLEHALGHSAGHAIEHALSDLGILPASGISSHLKARVIARLIGDIKPLVGALV